MEFDEMQKIWEAQNHQPLYLVEENKVYRRIQAKMNIIPRATTITDWILMIIYLGAGGILVWFNRFKPWANIFLFLEAAWMIGIVGYLGISYFRRIKSARRFDRSVHADLDHAISLAIHQMRVGQIIRWNFLPMGAIMIFSGWQSGKLLQAGAIILVSYTLAFFVTSWGYNFNKKRKRALQVLKDKLESGT